jgi:hypothetical protein
MILEQIVNSIASLAICIATTTLMYDIYASPSSPMSRYPLFKTWHIRLGLSGTAAGSLLNVLTGSTPPMSEVVLNIGLAFLFGWTVWFYSKYFKIEKPRITKRRK